MTITKKEVLENLDAVKKFIEEAEQEKKEVKEVKFEIKNRWTGKVLFSSSRTTYREAILEAISTRANLTRANLTGADLTGANLTGADLTDARSEERRVGKEC